jgi:hypothetical protein
MTRKDFELLAGAISSVEALDHMDEHTLTAVVNALASEIGRTHPRFNRGRFEAASMPLRSLRLKQAAVEALA